MEFDWLLSFWIVIVATLVAIACLFVLAALGVKTRPASGALFQLSPSTVFIFDGDDLVDATPEAKDLFGIKPYAVSGVSDLFHLMTRLDAFFPDFALRLKNLANEGRFVLKSHDYVQPALVLRAEFVGGLTKITLVDQNEEAAHPGLDGAADLALRAELEGLRDFLSHAPILIWRETSAGEIVWANSAYVSALVANLSSGKELTWPLPALFAGEQQAVDSPLMSYSSKGVTKWYDIVKVPKGDDVLCFAVSADRLLKLEGSLGEFKQTFSKIFAQLPIGLAIFDQARGLQMFNPALLDLTNLPVEFLAARPNLESFLDALRERKLLPEPKDYRSWRNQIVAMEQAAALGVFEELWTLPSGNTWRVTGRPHPNGALVFLIEDISTEISQTRRFRAEVEQSLAVLDAMPDGAVVFAQDGTVSLANHAARVLWQADLTNLAPNFGEPGVISLWRERASPTLLWDDLRVFIGTFTPREPWLGQLCLLDGRHVECHVSPLKHGATLVMFRLVDLGFGVSGLAQKSADRDVLPV